MAGNQLFSFARSQRINDDVDPHLPDLSGIVGLISYSFVCVCFTTLQRKLSKM